MLTPQEAREKATFEKAVFGGYSMNTVDDFVSPLLDDYAALYKDNAVLKSKMKVLVERLETYRTREESMNKALLAAQKTADELVQEAERKCAQMIADTEESLRQRNMDLKQELAAEAERVSRARKTANAYISEIQEQVQECYDKLEAIKQLAISPKAHSKVSRPAQPAAAEAAPAVQEAPAAAEPDRGANIQEILKNMEQPAPQRNEAFEENMSREIERCLSKMLEQDNAATPVDNTGDTKVIPTIGH